MGIKLSADPTPQIQPAERLRAGFILALGGLVTVFKRVILPHLCLAAGLWLLTMFALYRALWTGGKAGIIAGVGSVLLAIVAVALAMGYAFLTSLFAALKTAATYAEDFFYELFEALKEKIRAQIDNMEEGIAKQQAKVMLDNSVREVLSPLKKLRVGSVPAALGAVLLAVLTFISRSVFLAKLARVSGTTVRFSAIFSSRATLVGALFLNMRWLAALGLWLLYLLGLMWVILTVWMIW